MPRPYTATHHKQGDGPQPADGCDKRDAAPLQTLRSRLHSALEDDAPDRQILAAGENLRVCISRETHTSACCLTIAGQDL